MKPHIRVLGIDDGPFTFQERRALFAGVMMRLPSYIESMAIGYVEVDGSDSTERIAEMVEKEGWKGMLHAILIDGAALAGFNIVDIDRLNRITGIPVITVTSEKPDMESIKQALKGHFDSWEERYEMLGRRVMYEMELDDGALYISFSGTDMRSAVEIVRKSVVRGLVPEPIRIAHMMARAIRKGVKNETQPSQGLS